jgi:uncharacterized membrane protein
MKRTEWLIKLEQELTRLGVIGPREVVADYEEHFSIGASQGKSEEDIAAKLGDPAAIARAHHAENLVTKVTAPAGSPNATPEMADILRATFRLLLLTPFNFIMLICPFLIIATFLFTGWLLSAVFSAVSVVLLVVAALCFPFLLVNFWSAGAVLFGALGFVCMTGITLMTMYVATKWIINLFVSYLRWNVNFVLEK